MEKMSSNKEFWEQRLVKKTCFTAKVIFFFSSNDGVFCGEEYAPYLSIGFEEKELKSGIEYFPVSITG